MSEEVCRGCGARIIWAKNPATGKMIPLDPRPPVYLVTEEGAMRANGKEGEAYYVSHFATCPKANQFSGGGK